MLTQHRRNLHVSGCALLAIGLLAATATSQQKSTEGSSALTRQDVLERYVGAWTLTEHHYDAAGKVIATVKGTEEVAWVLDQRAIQRIYISTSDLRIFRAIGLLTWNEIENKYHGTWLDNVSKGGPTVVKGDWDAQKNSMVFSYNVLTAKNVAREFQVVDRFVDDSTRIATTFELTGGKVQKLTEVEYKRAVPCPAKLRILPDIGG